MRNLIPIKLLNSLKKQKKQEIVLNSQAVTAALSDVNSHQMKIKLKTVCSRSNCLPAGSVQTQVGKRIHRSAHLSCQLRSHVPADAQRCFTCSSSSGGGGASLSRVERVFLPAELFARHEKKVKATAGSVVKSDSGR